MHAKVITLVSASFSQRTPVIARVRVRVFVSTSTLITFLMHLTLAWTVSLSSKLAIHSSIRSISAAVLSLLIYNTLDISYISTDTSTTWCAADEQCDIVAVILQFLTISLSVVTWSKTTSA
jgi:hypothetical protein